jgi:DNA polymerase-3 subunit delta
MPGVTVTSELIDALVPRSRELSNFDLTDHLVGGRRKQALTALRQMLKDGAEPVVLLGLLGATFRQLFAIKDLMLRDADRGELQKYLRGPWDKQQALMATARRTDLKKLTSALSNIAKTDLAIKTSMGGSGPKAARMQIERLVCELALM